MGTRADFYVGRGEKAEWLGSIAWDGYTVEGGLLDSKTETEFRTKLEEFSKTRRDWTSPQDGWPWPWEDSRTTDYAYAFDGGKVWASRFGREWHDPLKEMPENLPESAVFPDMKKVQKVTFGPRSGVIVVRGS
jgi:hypothetical protein